MVAGDTAKEGLQREKGIPLLYEYAKSSPRWRPRTGYALLSLQPSTSALRAPDVRLPHQRADIAAAVVRRQGCWVEIT